MSRALYLECESGISGDMFVAALLDLGADQEKLKKVLESIPVKGAEIVISRVKKSGLDVCDFLVKLDEIHENHDHDMEYLHGHEQGHHHGGEQSHGHHHGEEHSHGHHCGGAHPHEDRGLPEILELLRNSAMSERAYEYARRIFLILAEAEAKAHGVPVEQVHFHEVGAIDSILDIAAAAICLDDLDLDRVYIPELTEGCGTIRCQHGILPVPVPAVSNIAAAWGLPLRRSGVRGELITPTGAAIAAAIRTGEQLPEHYIIERIGLGAGKRNYETPGFLRAMLIRENAASGNGIERDRIWKMETDVDDCTGEVLGYVMELLLEAGARDVHYTPVYMKKNRPAVEITVICDLDKREQMERILFRETTTIGIRGTLMERSVLERSFGEVETPWGPVGVKRCRIPGEQQPRVYVEYRDAEKAARNAGVPLRDVCLFAEKARDC
ncbi:MAG: nickel pincer cofactor biosynthesis protein LarC [Lachnospiraceae bacterium]|nr:nickel pincer cofactor biosynthesis protein LarC [Lachnospiraceae bacterium]